MRDCGRSRDRGYLYTAVQEPSQDPTQMPKSQWDNTDVMQLYYQEENLEHTLHFPAGLTDFPVRAAFSAAWPVLGGLCFLQPHIVYLFLYLHYRTCVRETKQPGLLPRRASSLSRIGGVCQAAPRFSLLLKYNK